MIAHLFILLNHEYLTSKTKIFVLLRNLPKHSKFCFERLFINLYYTELHYKTCTILVYRAISKIHNNLWSNEECFFYFWIFLESLRGSGASYWELFFMNNVSSNMFSRFWAKSEISLIYFVLIEKLIE